MRRHMIFICTALLVASLAGCAPKTNETPQSVVESINETPFESSVSEQQSTTNPETVTSPPAELKIPGEITVYKFYRDSGIFEPYKVAVDKGEVALIDIVSATETQLDVKIPVKGITQQKGMVVIDIAEGFVESHGKAEAYQILTSLAATLQQNHMSFEWIQYRQDGGIGIFGEQWEIPPLKLIEGTPEEFASIRAKIPYEGLVESFWSETPILDTDETGLRLTRFLAMLRLIDKEVSSPTELDNQYVLETAVFATKYYSTNPIDSGNYAPELKELEAPASEAVGFHEDWFWLKEHVEQSARLLYGDNVTIKHEDFGKYRYLDSVGVYTPPHMGGGHNVIPVIFSYEDLGDRYKIELTYVIENMSGYFDPDGSGGLWEQPIDEKDLKRYVQAESKRREVVLKKAGDNEFTFVSHKYL